MLFCKNHSLELSPWKQFFLSDGFAGFPPHWEDRLSQVFKQASNNILEQQQNTMT